MSEAKHTPGPWTVGGNGPWICTVGNNHDDPAIFGPRPADGESFEFGDKLADANLIAADPELLEAVLEALKYANEEGISSARFPRVQLEAAIAKAGGAS